jgi:hypothetical protein
MVRHKSVGVPQVVFTTVGGHLRPCESGRVGRRWSLGKS